MESGAEEESIPPGIERQKEDGKEEEEEEEEEHEGEGEGEEDKEQGQGHGGEEVTESNDVLHGNEELEQNVGSGLAAEEDQPPEPPGQDGRSDDDIRDSGAAASLAEDAAAEQQQDADEETYEYTEDQVREMRKAFKVYDEVGNDTVPVYRLGDVLRALALNPTERQLGDASRWLDAEPGRGVVRFKEFLVIMGRVLKDPITVDRVLAGFMRLDYERTGVVSRDVLHQILTTSGEKLYPYEFAAFIKYADPKKRGVVKYNDFVRKMTSGKFKLSKKKRRRKKRRKKKKKLKVKKRQFSDSSSSSDDESPVTKIRSV